MVRSTTRSVDHEYTFGEPRMIAAGPPGRNRGRVESARL
jgi:hypothetical protein